MAKLALLVATPNGWTMHSPPPSEDSSALASSLAASRRSAEDTDFGGIQGVTPSE